MDYKLIALDLDGTLTNSRKEITPRTRYALLDAQAQGKKVILASGRHPLGVYPIARDLHLDRYGGYIMSFNGGKIIECATDRTIVTKLFPREYLPDIMSVLQDSNLTVITWDDKRIFANNKVNDYTYIEKDVLKIEMVVVDDFLSSIKFDYNDMTMIGYAGMGVAMANGEPEIKKIANYVCPSNDEDGIAQALQKFVLK